MDNKIKNEKCNDKTSDKPHDHKTGSCKTTDKGSCSTTKSEHKAHK